MTDGANEQDCGSADLGQLAPCLPRWGRRHDRGPSIGLLALLLIGCGSQNDLVLGSNDFTLQRRDDFDVLDTSFWELASHTFDPNLAWFSPSNARVENGLLILTISAERTPADSTRLGESKPYAAAEVRTRTGFLYGRFRARARFAPGSGVVSTFWGFYDRYSMSSGEEQDNQIVIEGANTPENVIRYTVAAGPSSPKPTQTVGADDQSTGFHEIGFDWTPRAVQFFFDGRIESELGSDTASSLSQYQRLVLSAYPTSAAWAGEFDPNQLPVAAAFDWVETYTYTGPLP